MLSNQNTEDEPLRTKKLRQEVTIKLNNGDIILGRIFTGFKENIFEILHDERHFLPIELKNHSIVIIAKKEILAIDSFQKVAENASEFENNIEDSILYHQKKQSESLKNDNTKIPNQQEFTETIKYYDEIYQRYTHIIKILNSSIFIEKRKIDKQFDNDIHNIIDALKATATLLEQTKRDSK